MHQGEKGRTIMRMRSRRRWASRAAESLLLLFALTSCAWADGPFAVARAPLSGEPVLVFVEPTSLGPDRREQLFLLDPARPEAVHSILTTDFYPKVWHRIDRYRFLLQTSCPDGVLWRIDLEHGSRSLVYRGKGSPSMLPVGVGRGYFHLSMGQVSGCRIDPDDDSKFLHDRPFPKGQVYRFDLAGEDLATPIAEDTVESVMALTDTDAWGVTTDPDDCLTLKRIPLAGGAVQSVSLPLEGGRVTFALSPSGRLVGLGVGRSFSSRDLVVVDMEAAKIVLCVPDVSVRNTDLSPNLPYLQLIWVDEQTLRFGEARRGVDGSWKQGETYYVDVEIPSGRRLREYRAGGLPFTPRPPPRVLPPKPESLPLFDPFGAFEIKRRGVFLKGVEAPIGESIDSESVSLSPDRHWIAWREQSGGSYPQCLGDTRTGRVVRVTRPWGYGLQWFPAAR